MGHGEEKLVRGKEPIIRIYSDESYLETDMESFGFHLVVGFLRLILGFITKMQINKLWKKKLQIKR